MAEWFSTQRLIYALNGTRFKPDYFTNDTRPRLIIDATSTFPSVERRHHDAAPSANAEVKPMLGAIVARIYEMVGLRLTH